MRAPTNLPLGEINLIINLQIYEKKCELVACSAKKQAA